MARFGVPVGGRVRKLRAVGAQTGRSPKREVGELEEGIGSSRTILLARRTRRIKLCSSDACSEGQSGGSLEREGVMVQRSRQKALARANGAFRHASAWADDKVARGEDCDHQNTEEGRIWRGDRMRIQTMNWKNWRPCVGIFRNISPEPRF